MVGISNFADVTLPALSTTTFDNSTEIDNPYFPLNPGTLYIYEGEEVDADDGETELEKHLVIVIGETKDILGIISRVVRDSEFVDGVLVEDTFDWYAQDTEGNVWYLGEFSTNFEYDEDGNLVGTNNDGSWEAGVDGALPGILEVAFVERVCRRGLL